MGPRPYNSLYGNVGKFPVQYNSKLIHNIKIFIIYGKAYGLGSLNFIDYFITTAELAFCGIYIKHINYTKNVYEYIKEYINFARKLCT